MRRPVDPTRVRSAARGAAKLGALVAILSGSASAFQQPQLADGDKLCGECHTTGKIAFEVPKEVVEQEVGCTFCSEVATSELLNYGLDYKPCPKCLAPSLQAQVKKQWDAERQARIDWLKNRREIDDFLADPKNLHLMHVSTPHFELAWSIPKVKIGRVVFDQHQSMHLYAKRLEDFYKLWLDTFGFNHETDEMGVRPIVMCFESAKHANKAQPKYCGMGGTGVTDGVKLMGYKSLFVCWWNKVKNTDDDQFHEYLMHNMQHLFLCTYYPNQCHWLARKNGWIDEGLSHYFTDKLFKASRTHCFQEQDEAKNWVLTPWRPEIRKRVAADKIPVFADVIVKHGENLNADEHLMVFSWVQYLLDSFGKDKFVALIQGLKNQQPLRDVFQATYGVSPFQFIDAWKKYVIETYPPR
jgi:hypothetical protein